MIPLHIFPCLCSLKFGACYITAQWKRVQDRNTTLCFHLVCQHFFVVVVTVVAVFHHKICVSVIFNSFFRWSIKFPLQNINQPETEIRGRKLSVEMYLSVLFELKYLLRLLRRFNFIRYKKQHVKQLLLRCFLYITIKLRYQTTITIRFSHKSQKNKI